MDLLPFFLGKRDIFESLPVRKTLFFSIDDCQSIRNTPYIQVRITADEPLVDIDNSNILSLTVESLYNLPNLMVEDMVYNVAVHIPISEDVIYDRSKNIHY